MEDYENFVDFARRQVPISIAWTILVKHFPEHPGNLVDIAEEIVEQIQVKG